MNICFISNGYPPEDGGGIGSYIYNLATSLIKQGHKVYVITKSSIGDKIEDIAGAHIYRYKIRYFPKIENLIPGLVWSRFVAQKIKQLGKEVNIDILELPNWEGVGYWFVKLNVEIPTVTRLHTGFFETFSIDNENKKPKIGDRFTFWLEKQAVVYSTKLLSSAQYHRSIISHEYGIDDNRIKNIPLGIQVNTKERDTKSKGDVNILTVGRLEHRKGTIDLIDIIPKILEQCPNVQFTFIGNDRPHAPGGVLFKDYFEEKYLELSSKVKFLGFVDYSEMTKHYEEADIFVLPSRCENFGIVYIEAMNFGIPVVGYDVSAVPEVVQNGKTGILVDLQNKNELKDAILRLVTDAPLRKEMGNQARQWVAQKFDQDKIARETEEYFQEVIREYGL